MCNEQSYNQLNNNQENSNTTNNNQALETRIEKIENYLRSGKVMAPQNITNNMQPNTNLQNSAIPKSQSVVAPKNANTNNTNKNTTTKKPKAQFSNRPEEYWPQIVNHLKQNGKIVLYTNLMETKAVPLNDMIIGIEFPNGMTPFGKTVLEKQENIREISNLVSLACGKEMQIKYLAQPNQAHIPTNEENLQNLANEADIPFNIIE